MDSEAQGFKRELEKQKKLASDILKLSGVPPEKSVQDSIKDLNMALAIIWKAAGVPEDDVVELFRLALESVEVGD